MIIWGNLVHDIEVKLYDSEKIITINQSYNIPGDSMNFMKYVQYACMMEE